MEIQGKVLQVLPEQRFNGRNGELVRNSFVVEVVSGGNYAKKMRLDVLKLETWAKMNVVAGANVQVSFDIESREWNGKWFTSLNCWRCVVLDAGIGQSHQQVMSQPSSSNNAVVNGVPYQAQPQPSSSQSGNDDLPF